MSRHLGQNPTTLLLNFLVEEEANVATAEEEVARCLAAVEYHKKRVYMLRAALEDLEVAPPKSQSMQEETS